MAITELVFPKIKKDPSIADHVDKEWRPLFRIFTHPNPGLVCGYRGWVISQDGKDMKNEFKEILLLEWVSMQAAETFISSEPFAKFANTIKPLVTGPSTLQFHETTTGPREFGAAAVPEIFQVALTNDDDFVKARQAWEQITEVVGDSAVQSPSGKSTNLAENVFSGLLGWKDAQSRADVTSQSAFEDGLAALQDLGQVTQMVVDLEPIEL